MPVEAHATGPIARGGSGGHASRRTISGSARSMCREVPLWYPRARDGAATVCSMARARLPKARVGASDETSKWELQNLCSRRVLRERSFAGIVPSKAFILFIYRAR